MMVLARRLVVLLYETRQKEALDAVTQDSP